MVRGNITTWLGRDDVPVLGHLHVPTAQASGAVVLCPPLGREQVASYRALRQLGDSLAQRGFLAVRFAWSGQHDSSPIDEDLTLLQNWEADLQAVLQQLHDAGIGRIHLLGLRLGALLAARQSVALHQQGLLDSLLLWDAVPSGRQFLRHEQLLYASDGLAQSGTDSFDALGYSLRAGDADELRALKLKDMALPQVPVGRITRSEQPVPYPGVDGQWSTDEQQAMLETSSMTATVPARTLAGVLRWVGAQRGEQSYEFSFTPREVAELREGDASVRETILTLPTGLPAILTEPADSPGDVPVLYVAASSEPLDGPSGLWATSARQVAAQGAVALRVDKHGTGELGGELPTDPLPYMPGFTDDVGTAARWLTARTGRQPVGVGLCSGVYFEMVRPNAELFSTVVGINLLAFDRDPADIPDEVAMATDPGHLSAMQGEPANPSAKQRLRHLVKTRLPQPAWRALGRVGVAHAPDDFLREAAQRTELVLAFSREDWAALAQQRGEAAIVWARRTGAPFEAFVDPELDHALFGATGRRRCLQIIRDEVSRTRRRLAVAA